MGKVVHRDGYNVGHFKGKIIQPVGRRQEMTDLTIINKTGITRVWNFSTTIILK